MLTYIHTSLEFPEKIRLRKLAGIGGVIRLQLVLIKENNVGERLNEKRTPCPCFLKKDHC